MAYDQTTRVLRIDTDLGPDEAVLTELTGRDSLSEPYLFTIRFATSAEDDKVQKLLGTNVTLWFGDPIEPPTGPTGAERRFIHGRFRKLTMSALSVAGEREWQAEVVPDLWFLSRTRDLRIFQDKTVVEIIEEVLKLHHVEHVSIGSFESYPKIDYCVQYRESALDFVSRLMEQYGLFFWHEHESGRHILVISDNNSATFPGPFPELEVRHRLEGHGITLLEDDLSVGSGTWTMRDFNFETPSNDLEVTDPTQVDVAETKRRELYDYPGLYPDKDAGKSLARTQIQAEEALYNRRRGESSIAGLDAGTRIRIATPQGGAEQEKEFLVTEIRHEAKDYSHWTAERLAGRQAEEPYCRNSFVCIPRKIPFRSPRRAPKPFVRGPQTAIVTGPKGEEIYTDKYARVKVQFHWDRLGQRDEHSSCWVRVSQSWAGTGYGFIQIPRIGQEVIVDFLEGNPDRPIITGRVYNAEQMPPHGLPGAAVKSGLKSNSTKGGGGSNELTFDDTKGNENVYFHAQYNMDTVVEHDETQHVKNDRTITVDGTHTETVKKDTTVTITEGNYVHKVNTGTASTTVKGKVTETFQNAQETTVTQGITIKSTGSFLHVTTATDIVLEVGASKIALYADGRIEIKGKSVAINGSDAVNISGMSIKEEAGNDHSISGNIVQSAGQTSNTVRGGMVMLNPN